MTIVWDIQFPTQAQKLIALKLADYASDSGNSVYPSNESLARKAGCDERTVQRSLKAFRDCGLLHLVKQGGSGPKDTNEWWLNVELLRALSEDRATMKGCSSSIEIDNDTEVINKGDMEGDRLSPIKDGRVTSDPLRVTPVSAKGDTSVTQSVTNRQLEPSKRAQTREGSKSDFGSEGANPSKAFPCFLIQPADTAWQAWIDHFRATDQADLAFDANQHKRIRASCRWPKPGVMVFEPARRKLAAANTKRITGEDAA